MLELSHRRVTRAVEMQGLDSELHEEVKLTDNKVVVG